jgi:Spherulation-specific family 4
VNQRLSVPAYFVPGPEWTRLVHGAPFVGMAVMNRASGPGSEPDETYAPVLAHARTRGVVILGYVDTANASRSAEEVMLDIARYFDWYQVDGIFFDRTAVSCAELERFLRPLYEHVKARNPSSVVVLNAGAPVLECFMTASDVVVEFEGAAVAYRDAQLPRWRTHYHPSRFWHIVYGTEVAALDEVLHMSRSRRAGWLTVTDQALEPAPPDVYLYDRLPHGALWSGLLRALAR